MSHEAHIPGIFIYPVTSTAALAVDRAAVEPRGLAEDRRRGVTDESGEFLIGHEHPRLVMIRARPAPDGLTLRAPGMPGILVASGTRAYEEDGGQRALIIDTAAFALKDSRASALLQRASP